MNPDAVQRYLHEHIPLSSAMETRVKAATAFEVVLEAPLAPNLNHRATAFGGSVAALAILAGWTLVHLRLHAEGIEARTVIQRSDVRYLAPVEGTFDARTEQPAPESWRRFLSSLRRWGRARIRVSVEITEAGNLAGSLDADYVSMVAHEV
jgi:thioesterase domain-containing protein